MTPQLQQAIKMLQLSNIELTEFVDAEIQQNPLLERREARLDDAGAAGSAASAETARRRPLRWQAIADDFTPEAAEHWHAAAGCGGRRLGRSRRRACTPWHSRNGGAMATSIGLESSRRRAARAHCASICWSRSGPISSDPGDRVIALHLLDLLDEAGYLRAGLDGAAQLLGCETARVEARARTAAAIRPARRFRPRPAGMSRPAIA